MKLTIWIPCLFLIAAVGCADATNIGFGPYPASSIGVGPLTAGVASFVPGTVPTAGEFLLTVANTDADNTYTVTVTALGSLPLTRTVASCGVANYAVPCDADSVLIELAVTGSTPVQLTITPDPENCLARVVYIGVPVGTGTGGGTGGGGGMGGGTGTATNVPTLTETVPASAVNCYSATTP
jgi:hypothetical protein